MSTTTDFTPIPPVDLAAERADLGPALSEALNRVLESGRYILGPEVEAFERDFAALHRARFGVGVASGTDALIVSLKALGVGPGDGVVTSPFTFFASAGCIAWIGARPQLCDVNPDTALIDPETARGAIDSTTRCLLPVHLYGQLVDMKGFRSLADEKGVTLLEDAAQAHGAERDGVRAGELGDTAAFSFYPTKNLGAAGEGGLVLCNDDAVHRGLELLRDHGMAAKYEHASIGTNTRLQAMQGAVLNVKLPHLEAWNDRRRAVAARYDEAFASHDLLSPLVTLPGSNPVYHQYTLRILGDGLREKVLEGLQARRIFAALHYPKPVHLQAAAREWGYGPGDFPGAEQLAREVLCLPVHPFLSGSDVQRVIESVLELAGR
jgi:dTDP-4-amino-4,6-dideoxygalactose transaminase